MVDCRVKMHCEAIVISNVILGRVYFCPHKRNLIKILPTKTNKIGTEIALHMFLPKTRSSIQFVSRRAHIVHG